MKEIILSTGLRVKVDDEDYLYFNRWLWAENVGYAYRTLESPPNRYNILLHIEILKYHNLYIEGLIVDHKDKVRSNCQKYNLHMVSYGHNSHNRLKRDGTTSQYIGVSFNKSRQKWRARIVFEGRTIDIGFFDSEIEAAKKYDKIIKRYYGEFANTNFKTII